MGAESLEDEDTPNPTWSRFVEVPEAPTLLRRPATGRTALPRTSAEGVGA